MMPNIGRATIVIVPPVLKLDFVPRAVRSRLIRKQDNKNAGRKNRTRYRRRQWYRTGRQSGFPRKWMGRRIGGTACPRIGENGGAQKAFRWPDACCTDGCEQATGSTSAFQQNQRDIRPLGSTLQQRRHGRSRGSDGRPHV